MPPTRSRDVAGVRRGVERTFYGETVDSGRVAAQRGDYPGPRSRACSRVGRRGGRPDAAPRGPRAANRAAISDDAATTAVHDEGGGHRRSVSKSRGAACAPQLEVVRGHARPAPAISPPFCAPGSSGRR